MRRALITTALLLAACGQNTGGQPPVASVPEVATANSSQPPSRTTDNQSPTGAPLVVIQQHFQMIAPSANGHPAVVAPPPGVPQSVATEKGALPNMRGAPVPTVERDELDDDPRYQQRSPGVQRARLAPHRGATDPYAHPGITILRDGPGINAIPCRAFVNGWDCHFINQQRFLEAARGYGPPRRASEHGFQSFQSTVPERRPFKGFVPPDR